MLPYFTVAEIMKDRVRQQLVKDIMTTPIYAGYMQAPIDWGLQLHKGWHDSIISFATK